MPTIPDYWVEAIAEQNAITRKVAEEMHVAFYDLMANLPVDGGMWFSDNEHQNAAGTREQARQYAAFLVEQGLAPSPGGE